MTNKNNFIMDDQQSEYNIKSPLAKHEYDLFDEEEAICNSIIRVKRVNSANKEKWKIMKDSKEVFIIDGNKVSKKEKEYLRTPEGFNFLIYQYKDGIKSLNKIRSELKKILK